MTRVPWTTAGVVRRDGVGSMAISHLEGRGRSWAPQLAGATLILAIIVPHLWIGGSAYAFAFAACLFALEILWTLVPRDERGEALAFGVVLGTLFIGLAESLNVPNSLVGPLLLGLAAALTGVVFRAFPARGQDVDGRTRIAGGMMLAGTMWMLIMLVRMLQHWPPWG